MAPSRSTVAVEVDGRTLTLSNLDKVLFGATGFTKGALIDYYSRIADVLLPYLRGRPVTLVRAPDGVAGQRFFAKNVPRGAPEWLRTVRLPAPGSTRDREMVDYVVVDDLPTLVWAANLAGVELHAPMWTVRPDDTAGDADLFVVDLDPGAPATIVECARVALLLRDELREHGLEPMAKTSGSKGMQLLAGLEPVPSERTRAYARSLAHRLAGQHPGELIATMTKKDRAGKVLLDWSQNTAAKTTVVPYSVRLASERPTASTPLSWDEVAAIADGEPVSFVTDDVLDRVSRDGDLMARVLTDRASLPD